MLRYLFLFSLMIDSSYLVAQQMSYSDSMKMFREDYISKHEVVQGNDKNYFRFFPIDSNYRITCRFDKIVDTKGFIMTTSGARRDVYIKYGKLSFTIHDTSVQLFIYQNKDFLRTTDYKDYLFLPYTDNTSGYESHDGGKYLDLIIADIKKNIVIIDFNKAYNPYCAYSSDYSCPIPPKENTLPVSIRAGEMEYAKPFK
jgi:uncharacterized protein (DUF1684 family)